MLWILQKNEGKTLFNLRFKTPRFLHSIFKTRNPGFSGTNRTTTNLNKTSIFVQANNIWSSLANCDTLCRRLTVIKTDRCDYSEAFPKISTHYLVADIRIRRYIYISIHYNTSLKKPWHTFVFPNQDMWKLNMFIVSASDS